MASVLSRIQIILEANTANYNNELRRVRENSDSTFKKIGKAAGAMTLAAGAAIVGLGATSLKVAGNFEAAMGGVQAVSNATGKDFDDLKEKAKELGSTTAYSATEAANGMEFLAMAGMDTKQVLDTIPHALSLAAAGNLDLAASADIMSNIMTGMGLESDQAQRAADVLASTAAGANVDIAMLGESMKYAAPIAKQLGLSLEDTAASIGILGNAGIQGSEAGTALRSIYTRLATHKKARLWFDQLGLSVTDSTGKLKGMVTIFKEMQDASKDMSAQDKLTMFKDSVGTEAMSALGVTIDSIADGSLDKLIAKLADSEGAAKKMADIRMSGLNGELKGLASAWEGFLIELSDGGALEFAAKAVKGVTTGLRDLTKGLPEAIKQFKAFVENYKVVEKLKAAFDLLKGAVEAVGSAIEPVVTWFKEHERLSKALATAIGIVAVGFGIYTLAVSGAAIAMTAFATVMAIATAPLTLILIAITAVVAAGVYLYQNWDMIKEKGLAVWQSLKDSVSNFVSGVVQSFVNFKDSVVNTFTNIVGFIGYVWQSIKDTAVAVFNSLPEPIQLMARNILSVFTAIREGINAAFTYVSGIVGSIVTYISGQWNTFTSFFKDTTDSVKESVGSSFNSMAQSVSETLASIGEFFKPMVEGAKVALDFVADTFKSGFETVKNVVTTYIDLAISIFKGGLSGFLAVAETVLSTLATVFNVNFDLVKNLVSTAMNVVKALIKGDMTAVVTAFRTGLSNAGNIVKAGLNTVLGLFKALGTKLYTIGQNIIEGFINGVKSKFSGAIKAVTGFVDSIKNAFTRAKGFDIHSPSRVLKKIGKNVGEGFTIGLESTINDAVGVADFMVESIKSSFSLMKNYVITQKDFSLPKAIADANSSVIGSIQTLRKEIVLFGNDSKLAAFEYEVAIGSLKHASKEYLEEYRKGLVEVARLEANALANDTAKKALQNRLKEADAFYRAKEEAYKSFSNTLLTEDEKRLEVLKEQLALIDAMGSASDKSLQAAKVLSSMSAVGKYQSVYNTDTRSTAEANKDDIRDSGVNSEMAYNNQLAGLQSLEQTATVQQAITDLEMNQAEKRRQIAIDTAEAEKALYAEKLDFVGQTYSTMTDLVTGFAGENSRISKVMFAVQKAHTLASIMLKSKEAISQAWASAPFPSNLGAVAMATLKTGVLQSAANAIKPNISGQAHNGLANVPKEGTYILDKNERVVRPSDNNKLTKFLDNADKGLTGTNITTHVTITGNNASVESNNAMGKDLGNVITAAIQKQLRTELKQGGILSR